MLPLFKIPSIPAFRKKVYALYAKAPRDFAWRRERDPYRIMVSEIMLQQTQTFRVEPKYLAFLKKFPTVRRLAAAPQGDVLRAWQGLGYNRRALALHRAAKEIVAKHAGKVPSDLESLDALPGIGQATAAAIMNYAYGIGVPFVETNVRAAILHDFFPGEKKIHDREVLAVATRALDAADPRRWHFALVDYGVFLKKTASNPSRRSAHHAKPSKFEGSKRQLRGLALRELAAGPKTILALGAAAGDRAEEMKGIVETLHDEGLIRYARGKFML